MSLNAKRTSPQAPYTDIDSNGLTLTRSPSLQPDVSAPRKRVSRLNTIGRLTMAVCAPGRSIRHEHELSALTLLMPRMYLSGLRQPCWLTLGICIYKNPPEAMRLVNVETSDMLTWSPVALVCSTGGASGSSVLAPRKGLN